MTEQTEAAHLLEAVADLTDDEARRMERVLHGMVPKQDTPAMAAAWHHLGVLFSEDLHRRRVEARALELDVFGRAVLVDDDL